MGTLLIFGWEAYENTFINSVQKLPCLRLEDRTEPDSAINMASDILVGNACMWTTAYLLTGIN